jgi:hypothetical protein
MELHLDVRKRLMLEQSKLRQHTLNHLTRGLLGR